MSHRDDLHRFDAAAGKIREQLQAATHGVTVETKGANIVITCTPHNTVVAEEATEGEA